MEQHDPNMAVFIAAVAADGTRLAERRAGAIFDAGAEACRVSPTTFEKLKGGVEGVRNIAHVNGSVVDERTARATVSPKVVGKLCHRNLRDRGKSIRYLGGSRETMTQLFAAIVLFGHRKRWWAVLGLNQ